ncbi:MAG TPA: hypothetical protein VL171_10045 [Verrucomicrobiae bacterium]|nr:hypothetical protein [Verrucomicrobiae bacterium]
MSNLRYVPQCRISINGTVVPSEMRGSISSVSFQTGLEGADRVELTLVNESLRWLDHPSLQIGNQLALDIGYAPDPLTRMFSGDIVSVSGSFPSGSSPTLSISAQDRRQRLQQGTKVRWFAIPIPKNGNFPVQDMSVVDQVTVEGALMPIIKPVGAAISAVLGVVEAIPSMSDPKEAQKLIRQQANESDFDLLSRIAKENGWELTVDYSEPNGGQKLVFMSPLDQLSPDVTLKYGQSLVEFSPHISTVGQIDAVTAFVWIPKIKTRFAITLGWDWDRMALTLDINTSASTRSGAATYEIEQSLTQASAPRKLVSELIPKLNKRLTGSGSVVGDPRIQAGSVLRMEGLGIQFGGLYRVTSATHTLDASGYRTHFEVRKEVWFGSIPLTEQSAIPVSLPSPLQN